MAMEKPVYVKGGQGREFGWKNDHAYVKVSVEDSGGRYSLVEDNLTTDFLLPKHLHREHSETFYVVSGAVEFQLADRSVVLTRGDTLYIPPNALHEVRCREAGKC